MTRELLEAVGRIPGTWLVVGFVGQALFSARFVVQWIMSERRGRSVIPVGFWWLSLGGGAVLFAYAVHRRDPVFILGQGMGLVVYARNLILIRRQRRRDLAERNTPAAS
jgi:lipid-A-disaccharide synthase-like uncharacterized protein